jgi:hypothetical protein
MSCEEEDTCMSDGEEIWREPAAQLPLVARSGRKCLV